MTNTKKTPKTETNVTETRTPDLYLAALYVALGARIVKGDRVGQRVFFVLSDVDSSWLYEWHSASIMVNASAYANAIKNLKSLLHSV